MSGSRISRRILSLADPIVPEISGSIRQIAPRMHQFLTRSGLIHSHMVHNKNQFLCPLLAIFFILIWITASFNAAAQQTQATSFESIENEINQSLARGEYEQTSQLAEQLRTLAESSHDVRYLARAQGYLGVIARRRGDLNAAVTHHKKAIEIRRNLNDDSGIANSLTNLGVTYRDLGQYTESLLAHLDAIELRRKLGPYERLDVNYRNIGLLYSDVEDFRTAKLFFELAETAARQFANPEDLAPVLGSYATLLNDVGEHELALQKTAEAFKIDQEKKAIYGMSMEHIEFARALIGLNREQEAIDHINQAYDLGVKIEQPDVAGRALFLRGLYSERKNNLDDALKDLTAATTLLETHQLRPWVLRGYEALSRVQQARGNLKSAMAEMRRYIALREEIHGINASRRLGALESQRQRERDQEENERQKLVRTLDTNAARNRRIVMAMGVTLLASLGFALLIAIKRNRELNRNHQETLRQQAELAAVNRKLREQSNELKKASVTDALTGVFNRRYIMEHIAKSLQEARKRSSDLSLMAIDLDYFKSVNDRFGHQIGDEILIEATRIMKSTVREFDIVARTGGEEFIIVFPDTTPFTAKALAERIRFNIASELARFKNLATEISASIGVVSLSQLDSNVHLDQFVRFADLAMYEAKNSTRNAVHVHSV